MIYTSPAFIKQLLLTLGASLSFLMIGLVRAYSSSALPSMHRSDTEYVLTSEKKSWIGSIAPLGAVFGSMVSGVLMQQAGRRKALLLTAPICIAAWLLLGLAVSYPVILLGRVLCGMCAGLVLAPTQVYVSECCDARLRGSLGSLPTLFMSAGVLISYFAGSMMDWRHLATLSSGFCVLVFFALLPLPESPVWLESRGFSSKKATQWLHLPPLRTAAQNQDPHARSTDPSSAPPSLFSREVLRSGVVVKPLVICFGLLILQQFSGIDAVIFYTVDIFLTSGSTLDPAMATIIVGLVQMLCNGISTTVLDKFGRKPLLLVSTAISSLSMATMGTAYYLNFDKSSWLGYLPIGSVIVFMVGYSLGLGGVPFVLLGEVFPAHYRSNLSALASTWHLITMFVVIKSYHSLKDSITAAGTFWMYSACCVAGFVFTLAVVPETKGKTLDEVELLFRSQKSEKEQDAERPTELTNRIAYIERKYRQKDLNQ